MAFDPTTAKPATTRQYSFDPSTAVLDEDGVASPSLGEKPVVEQPKESLFEALSRQAGGLYKRMGERAEATQKPTLLGNVVEKATGSNMAGQVAAVPERALRMGGQLAGNIFDIPLTGLTQLATVASRAVPQGAREATKETTTKAAGSLFDLAKGLVPQGAKDAIKTGIQTYQKLPEEAKLDINSLANIAGALPAGAITKTGGAKLADLLSKLKMPNIKGGLKKYIAEGVGLPQELLEKAATKQGKKELVASGKLLKQGGAVELASDVAESRSAQIANINSLLDDSITKLNNEAESIAKKITTGTKSQSEAATSLENMLSSAKSTVGGRFEAQESKYLGGKIGEQPLNFAWKEKLSKATNTIEDNISKVIDDTGATKGKIAQLDGHPVDNSDLQALQDILEEAGKAHNNTDALVLLRKVRGMYGQQNAKAGGRFYDNVVLGKADKAIQDAIETSLKNTAEKQGIGDDLVKLWRDNNTEFRTAKKALDDISRGASIGSLNPSGYLDNVQRLGAVRLLEIKKLAASDPAIAIVWKGIESGARDSLISRGIMADGTFKTKPIRSAIDNMFKNDSDAALTIFGEKKIQQILSGLDKLDGIGAEISAMQKEVPQIAGKALPALKSGALPERVTRVTNKTTQSRETLDQLRALDEIVGNDPASGFAQRAIDFTNAEKLGYRKTGPGLFPAIKTGIGGLNALVGGIAGMATGHAWVAPILAAGGAATQSPAGAIAAYRLINMATSPAARIIGGAGIGAAGGAAMAPEGERGKGALAGAGIGAGIGAGPELLRLARGFGERGAVGGVDNPQAGRQAGSGRLLGNQRGSVGGIPERFQSMKPAIRSPQSGKIYTSDKTAFGHKQILNDLTKAEPGAEKAAWKALFDDNAGTGSPYIGFVDKNGKFISRADAEKQLETAMVGGLTGIFHEAGNSPLPMLGLTGLGAGGALAGGIAAQRAASNPQNETPVSTPESTANMRRFFENEDSLLNMLKGLSKSDLAKIATIAEGR